MVPRSLQPGSPAVEACTVRALSAWARRCVLPGVLLGATAIPLLPSPAEAETARQAERRVAQVLAQVRGLQAQVDRATSDYQAAVASVADAISHGISAETRATESGRTAQDQRALTGSRVRALYRSGGPLALYATALDAGSVTEVLTRVDIARRIVGKQSEAAREALAVHAVDTREAAAAQARALAEVRGTRSVKRSYAVLTALLDQQQAILASVRGRARALRDIEAAQARLAAARRASETAGGVLARRANPMAGSPAYFALYRSAATTCPGLSWTVLAAIGQVESGHGRNPGVSYAGAQGPMQFMPATFAHYGVDGDGDGRIDIQSAADAIFTAARYLCANGAGKGGKKLYFAIYRYNHADWYVQLVLTLAAKYAARDGA